ncbi:MAG: PG0541 family transporter-associated protein [bacterium]
MKFLHVTFHFEYEEPIEEILDDHDIENFVRYPMMEGKDEKGKHYGSQVYPGNVSVIQAQVPEDVIEDLMKDLKQFKDAKQSHEHLEALVLPVDARLS